MTSTTTTTTTPDDEGDDDASLINTMQAIHDVAAATAGVYCSHANLPDDDDAW